MSAIPPDDIRASIAQRRKTDAKAERERVRGLRDHDRQAEAAAALEGSHNQPEDLGSDGEAQMSRPRSLRDADGEHRSSSARRGTVRRHVQFDCTTMCDLLCKRGSLTEDQRQTGNRIRGQWRASRQASSVTARYAAMMPSGSGMGDDGVYRQDARDFITRLQEGLTTPQFNAVVGVCGQDEEVGWRMKELKVGLDRAADVIKRGQR